MSDWSIPIAFGLAATLPAGALGWAAGALTDRISAHPGLRGAVWASATALTMGAALVPRLPLAAPAPVMVAALGPAAAPAAWMSSLPQVATGLVAIVALGATVSLATLAVGLVRSARWRRGMRRLEDAHVVQRVAARCRAQGMAPPEVLIGPGPPSAMLCSLVRPAILLPEALTQGLSAEDLQWVCLHELAHLKRGDNLRLLADRLVAALLWFNPFVVAQVNRRAAAREELCDRLALEAASAADRRRYAATLVQALRVAGPATLHPSFIHRPGVRHAMRLKAILDPAARPRRVALFAAATLSLGAAACALGVGSALAQSADRTTIEVDASKAGTAKDMVVITSDGPDKLAAHVQGKIKIQLKGAMPPGTSIEIDGKPIKSTNDLSKLKPGQTLTLEVTPLVLEGGGADHKGKQVIKIITKSDGGADPLPPLPKP